MDRRRWDPLLLPQSRVEISAGIRGELAEMAWEWPEMLRGEDWWRRVWEYCVLKVYSVSRRSQMSVQFDGIVLVECDGMSRKGDLKSFWRVVVLRVEVEALSQLVQALIWS